LCGSARARQCCCPLRVSVIDEHLMTVFNEVDGKSVSHMAETDYTDTSDDVVRRVLKAHSYGS
jgi:hypothetical protein